MLGFLACQTSTWQRFPAVSVTEGFIDRCHRMPIKPLHDAIAFFQHLSCCQSLMHSVTIQGSLDSLLLCTAVCAIAHHTQPCTLGHGSLYLALDQGKVMMLLRAVIFRSCSSIIYDPPFVTLIYCYEYVLIVPPLSH